MTEPTSAKIVVIGPVLPFRGGIAQYNTLLSRAFARRGVNAQFVSFRRQYPGWLYPGTTDRDPVLEGYSEPGVSYLIDSINPLTWVRTAREVAARHPKLVVFHWWTAFWAPCFALMIRLLQRRALRVALVCHNLADHDGKRVTGALSRHVIKMADAYFVHSLEHQEILRRDWPTKPVVYHRIPPYGHYPAPQNLLPKRGRLELLFFGFIRPYKGLNVLLDALDALADEGIYLTVIGEHWGDPRALIARAANRPNIELHLRYVSDAEAAEYFARADFVILPYKVPTPSAVAALAHHYQKPIIGSRVVGLTEVVIDGATGILTPPDDASALAQVIRDASRAKAAPLSVGVARFNETHGWDSLCDALLSLSVLD